MSVRAITRVASSVGGKTSPNHDRSMPGKCKGS